MATGKKVTLTVQQRLDVLEDLKTLPLSTVAEKYNVHQMTIRRIKSNATNIIQLAEKDKRRQRLKRPTYEELEKQLLAWFVQKKAIGDVISDALLLEKAIEIKDSIGSCSSFKVSKGWLANFKRRHNIRLHHVYGDNTVDKDAATTFVNDLKKLIKEEDINLENVYSMAESGLLWKALPTKSFTGETEKSVRGYKMKKERITFALCANATGTHKLRPFVIHKYKKPRALKDHIDKLPVVFKSQKNAGMDQNLFVDWYNNDFKTAVRAYQLEKGVTGKVILLFDNCAGHTISDTIEDEHFKIIYLPPNTTSLIQPMDQNIIKITKRCFRYKLMQKAITHEDGIQEFYKNYTIKDCIDLLMESWGNVTISNLRNAWNKIILHATIERSEEEHLLNEMQDAMATISERNVSKEDVAQFLEDCIKEESIDIEDEERDEDMDVKDDSNNDDCYYDDRETHDIPKTRGIELIPHEREELQYIFQRLEYYNPRVPRSTQLQLESLKLLYLGDP